MRMRVDLDEMNAISLFDIHAIFSLKIQNLDLTVNVHFQICKYINKNRSSNLKTYF